MSWSARPIFAQEGAEEDEGGFVGGYAAGLDAGAETGEMPDLPQPDEGPPPEPSGDEIAVPSGVGPRWLETRSDAAGPMGLTIRFRFVASGVGDQSYGPDQAATDLQVLCDTYALPRVANTGPQPAQLVLDLADRVVPFGFSDEEATQYFEAYSIAEGACQWELF